MTRRWPKSRVVAFANTSELSSPCGPLNRAAVLDRLGGDTTLLREITAIFLAEYPGLLAEIRDAIATGKSRDVERAAHTLKGSVSNFGVVAATKAALELELIGRHGRMADAPAAFNHLLERFRELEPMLVKLLQ